MSKFQLYINNEKADLYADESVSLTETIQDIRDVSKVFTDFTKPFTLPASDTNNKIFKHYYRFNLVDGYTFDARKKIDAKIELNTIPYRDGKIRLEGVDLENTRPKSYRVTFFGNTVNLKDILGDDELSGLSWLNNFNTTYSAAEIQNTLINQNGKTITADSVQYSKALIVPLISNTQRLYYNSGTAVPYTNSDGTDNTALGGNLYPTKSDTTQSPPITNANDVHGVLFEDLTYSIKLHLIVKAIQEQYEDITFSDDFLDLTNGPDAYKNLYMLLQKKEGRIFEDLTIAEKQIKGFPLMTQNNSMQMNNDALLVFEQNTSQTILGTYNFQFSGGHPEFTAIIKEGSNTVLRRTFLASSSSTKSISQQLSHSTQGYTLHVETTTAFTIDSCSFVGISPSGNQYTSQINSAISIPLEKEFIVTDNIPPMKVIDFLTSLFKMFNLTAFQKDGIIHVKTLESFYSSGTERDITDYVDPQSMQVDKALPYREIEFKYEDTESALAKQHEEVTGVEWGAAKYVETGNLNSNDKKFEVTASFAHLKYERLINTATRVTSDVQWGFMADEKLDPYFKKPVLFLAEYVNLNNDIRFLTGKNGTSSIRDISNYWMPSNFVSRNSFTSKESIHFDIELSEWDNTTAFTDTLFEKYHRFYIAGIFNTAKRLSKIRARLPKKFVVNFSLADVLVINNNKYRINSITTDLLTGSSQLELLNSTVNDVAASQSETGGGGGTGGGGNQGGSPDTNVLTLYQCASPNSTFEADVDLSTLNLGNNTRVVDTSGNTYKVTGNNAPNTYTAVSVTSTGLSDCPTTDTPPETQYYSLTKCSDNTTDYRTSTAVGSPTYAITQQVFDGTTPTPVKYIVRNATALDTVPSVTIASTPSPVQLTCDGSTASNYYSLNPCCSGNIYYGFSRSSSKTGTVVYNNETYTIGAASSGQTGVIDIDALSTGSCTTYYYSLNSCTDGSIQHYGHSNCSYLNNTQKTYNSTCYSIQNTTVSTGTIDIDTLSACSCPNPEVYWLLRECDAPNATVRTTSKTTDLSLQPNATPTSASLVQDSATGKCYTVSGTTTDTTTYPNPIGPITDSGQLGCPSSSCTAVTYYALKECLTGNEGFISGQTTEGISLSNNDIVARGSATGPRYEVMGTTTSGTSIGTVYTTSDVGCPVYYGLTQCYTNQTGYRTDQTVNDISLSVNDRVQDSCGMPYTVNSISQTAPDTINVGTVTDSGTTGCSSYANPQRYALTRCSDESTGYVSLQLTSDVTLAANDTVLIGTERYQNNGSTFSTNAATGVVCADGGNTCITEPTPPQPPQDPVYYARFITCDDPLGAVIAVQSTTQIGTKWVVKEVGKDVCYRWLDNVQGTNPTELNSSNFIFFTGDDTAGANCFNCESTVTPPPVVPEPPQQTCFALSLYTSETSAQDLCNQTTITTIYTNASTLASSTTIFDGLGCLQGFAFPIYLSVTPSDPYYYWDGSSLAGPYTQACP